MTWLVWKAIKNFKKIVLLLNKTLYLPGICKVIVVNKSRKVNWSSLFKYSWCTTSYTSNFCFVNMHQTVSNNTKQEIKQGGVWFFNSKLIHIMVPVSIPLTSCWQLLYYSILLKSMLRHPCDLLSLSFQCWLNCSAE